MIFKPFASGSKGNCYLLQTDTGSILIELGIPWKKVMLHLDFMTSKLNFALISHSHGDHSSAVKDALKAGIDVYLSSATAEALGVSQHHRIHILKAGEKQQIGSWDVLPFDLIHDVPCLGFLIAHDTKRLLFIPDTAYVKNRFTGITIAAIECNFTEDILSRNIQKGHLAPVVGHRIRRSHMSLQTVIEMLKSNDLSRCRQIFLLHLSSGNSDEAQMIKEVQEATGIPCIAC